MAIDWGAGRKAEFTKLQLNFKIVELNDDVTKIRVTIILRV